SSRRRHTRFSRFWSSDVCSSDLVLHEEDGHGFRSEIARVLREPAALALACRSSRTRCGRLRVEARISEAVEWRCKSCCLLYRGGTPLVAQTGNEEFSHPVNGKACNCRSHFRPIGQTRA